MLASQTTKTELFNACRVLFGPEVSVSAEFLCYLQPLGLKAAYKKKALETHPDRAKALGHFTEDLTERFRQVQQAYETLLGFLESNKRRFVGDPVFHGRRKKPHQKYSYRPTATRTHRPKDHYYSGRLPRRNLLLGQYLYYSGVISWRALIEAISWQRNQRPKIGQIALKWGMINSKDIIQILSERTLNEKFGECAKRIGYITNFEHIALVGKQRMLQKQIGEYFIKQGFVSEKDIEYLANKQRLHNRSSFGWK